jgi:hypothetical protein
LTLGATSRTDAYCYYLTTGFRVDEFPYYTEIT